MRMLPASRRCSSWRALPPLSLTKACMTSSIARRCRGRHARLDHGGEMDVLLVDPRRRLRRERKEISRERLHLRVAQHVARHGRVERLARGVDAVADGAREQRLGVRRALAGAEARLDAGAAHRHRLFLRQRRADDRPDDEPALAHAVAAAPVARGARRVLAGALSPAPIRRSSAARRKRRCPRDRGAGRAQAGSASGAAPIRSPASARPATLAATRWHATAARTHGATDAQHDALSHPHRQRHCFTILRYSWARSFANWQSRRCEPTAGPAPGAAG